MTDETDNNKRGIDRRTVLKSVGAASAAGLVGVPAFSGSAAANHPTTTDFKIYALEHNSHDGSDRVDRLLAIDSSDLSDGSISDPITVDTVDLVDGNGDPTDINTATLAAHPDGDLYGLDRGDTKPFRIEIPSTGDTTAEVELLGGGNGNLKDVFASAFDEDGNWFGVDPKINTLYKIDPNTGDTTSIGELTLNGDPYDAIHVGMGINFVTGDLWLVAGDKPSGQSDIFKLNTSDGSLTLAPNGEDALTAGRLVGGAFGPCANVFHVVRNRNELYGFEVGTGDEFEFGSLEYTNGQDETVEVGIDNLAVPYGFDCQECEDCSSDGALAKYEFECVEHECVEWDEQECVERICVNWDFAPESEGDEGISYTIDAEDPNYESKDGEENEPMSVTFDTDYCELYVLVKSGQELGVQPVSKTDGSITVENPSDKHAISFVEFYCTEGAANKAKEEWESRGGGNSGGKGKKGGK